MRCDPNPGDPVRAPLKNPARARRCPGIVAARGQSRNGLALEPPSAPRRGTHDLRSGTKSRAANRLIHGFAGPPLRAARGLAIAAALLVGAGSVGAQTNDARPNWRILWANDAIFGSDNQFTNGFGAAKHSALASSLDRTGGTPAFGRWLAGLVLPARDDLVYREGWTVGHNIQTPDNIQQRDIILDDVPYVSMAGWTNSHIAFNDRELTGFQTLVGWVGDITLGEQIQSQAHKLSDANDPKGWDNQLANEPLLNIYAMKKLKFLDTDWFDATANIDAGLGNLFTFGQAALELRFGRRPEGFAYQVNTVGHALDFDARIHAPQRTYLYTSVILRGTGFGHALPRDGNFLRNNDDWTDDNELNASEFVGQVGLGLHLERRNWGAHLNVYFATSAIENPGRDAVADPNNNFAVAIFEWQF